MNTHAIEWGDLVPFLAALTVLQVAVSSVSKLIATSELYKLKRFGAYSETAAVLSYCISALVITSAWWGADPTRPVQPDERRPITLEWLYVYGVLYATMLMFLLMFMLPLKWFKFPFMAAYFVGLVLAAIAATCAIYFSQNGWLTWPFVIATYIWVCYILAWFIRHQFYRINQSAYWSSILRRFVTWLDQS